MDDAETSGRETVKGCRASLGDSHPETLISITHLAAVLRQQKRFDESAMLAREVRLGGMELERDSKVQRNTLTATNILAELLHTMGNNDEALPLCREVLNGFLRAVGPNHPFTISAAENLSNVLRALGQVDEADKVLKNFGLKTPVMGDSIEEGDEEGDEGDEEEEEDGGEVRAGKVSSPRHTNGTENGNGKASNGKAKANGKAKRQLPIEDVD